MISMKGMDVDTLHVAQMTLSAANGGGKLVGGHPVIEQHPWPFEYRESLVRSRDPLETGGR